MILDVHVAYLLAALLVMFGLTYSISRFLDHLIAMAKTKNSQEINLEELTI